MKISENARTLFVEESREHLQDIENVLLAMEQSGAEESGGYVDQAFRAAHSIKGGAGFLGHERVREVAHAVEDTLESMRGNVFFPDRQGFDVLLRAFDTLGRFLDDLAGSEDEDCGELLDELSALPERMSGAQIEPGPGAPVFVTGPEQDGVPPAQGDASSAESSPAPDSVRVPVAVLDRLMNLAGELVLGRNRLDQVVSGSSGREAADAVQQVSRVAAELQDEVMAARMQPLGRILQRFPRQVRDLAGQLDKEIELTMHGLDVGLDKGLLDRLVEPLSHLVRNAADHGIEPVAERARLGKPPRGRMELRAWHGAGLVHVELRDDGRGMDRSLLVDRAVRRGVLSAEEIQGLDSREQLNLAMLPGVSCAGEVTDLSGRGVGMDVVKTLLDEVGGRIDLWSESGQGTRVRMSFPPTLVVMPCVLVRAGGGRYALPQSVVCELMRIAPQDFLRDVGRAGQAAMLHVRGDAVPVSDLARLLELSEGEDDVRNAGSREGHVHVVVIRVGAVRHALVVDGTEDVLDAVTRPLDRWLRGCPAYSGVTLLNDGAPALILDVSGLLHLAGVELNPAREFEADRELRAPLPQKDSGSLLFCNAPGEFFLLPLHQVDRVERISAADIALVGGHKVIRFRDRTVPVFALEEVLRVGVLEDGRNLVCILVSGAGPSFGLLAAQPVQTLEEDVVLDRGGTTQPGVRGTCPVPGGTASVLDLDSLQSLFGNGEYAVAPEVVVEEATGRIVLVVDDSEFFRMRIGEVLQEQGVRTVMASHGREAWEYLDRHGDRVGLIVTDLEMPVMDGFQLTQRIRDDARFTSLGIVALSSLADPTDMEAATSAGVDAYLVKLDEQELVAAVLTRMEK